MIGTTFNYHHEPNQIRIKLGYAQKIRFGTIMESLSMVIISNLKTLNAHGLKPNSWPNSLPYTCTSHTYQEHDRKLSKIKKPKLKKSLEKVEIEILFRGKSMAKAQHYRLAWYPLKRLQPFTRSEATWITM